MTASYPIPTTSLQQHVAIVGKTGSGKSYAAKGIVEQLIKSGHRVCVIDPGGDWWGLRAAGSGAGLPVAVLGGRHGDVAISPDKGAEVATFIASENVASVVDLSDWYKSDQIKFMVGFAETVYKENSAPLHLIIDEADQFSPQNPMAETKKLLNRMEIIVRLGRKRGFRVTLITQRPAILHKNVLTQANTLIAMRLVAPQDKKAIQAWISDNADAEQEKAMLKSLAKLERGTGWVWAPEEDLLDLVTFPENQTHDAGRTPDSDDEVDQPLQLADIDLEALSEKFMAPEPVQPAINTSGLEQQLSATTTQLNQVQATVCGLREDNAELRGLLEEMVSKAALALGKPIIAGSISEAPEPVGAPPKPISNPARQQTSGRSEPLVEAAASIWPVKLSWAALCAMCGRKARGGHFNSTRKRLIENGVVSEESGLVTLLSPPASPANLMPADLLEQNLPGPANKMFAAIRARPGMSREQLADALDMQPRGGHWNTGLSILRNNNLIDDGAVLYVKPDLLRAGLS